MMPMSEKVFLSLKPPTEEESLGDQQRIELALQTLGYEKVTMPLHVLQQLYPLCRSCDFDITVTLVYHGDSWVITAVEAGDQTKTHYGLAVDYGSTTIVMQLVDLHTGSVIAQAKEMNGQIAYGTDILTRITYTLEEPSHMEDMQRVTVETFHTLFDTLTWESGIDVKKCPILIISGNTTMIHFLLKLNAWTVFAAPYAPVTTAPGWLWGKELGMAFAGMVYMIPAASNYVGGVRVCRYLPIEARAR